MIHGKLDESDLFDEVEKSLVDCHNRRIFIVDTDGNTLSAEDCYEMCGTLKIIINNYEHTTNKRTRR